MVIEKSHFVCPVAIEEITKVFIREPGPHNPYRFFLFLRSIVFNHFLGIFFSFMIRFTGPIMLIILQFVKCHNA